MGSSKIDFTIKRGREIQYFLSFLTTTDRKNAFYISFQFIKHCVKSVHIRSYFWSVFSYVRTEYGDLRSKSPYSVRIQENTGYKNLCIGTLFTQ